jgi:proteasome lid subunit RPN8/RPN11
VKLLLPGALRDEIARQAKSAFPRECCGLIEGMREGDFHVARMLHPARNRAEASDRFEIDPADHIIAARSARGRGHRLIGCYHSHPNGDLNPSPHDGGGEEDFLWVIAATDGANCRLAAFVYRAPGFDGVVLSDALGADFVTSSLNERS